MMSPCLGLFYNYYTALYFIWPFMSVYISLNFATTCWRIKANAVSVALVLRPTLNTHEITAKNTNNEKAGCRGSLRRMVVECSEQWSWGSISLCNKLSYRSALDVCRTLSFLGFTSRLRWNIDITYFQNELSADRQTGPLKQGPLCRKRTELKGRSKIHNNQFSILCTAIRDSSAWMYGHPFRTKQHGPKQTLLLLLSVEFWG